MELSCCQFKKSLANMTDSILHVCYSQINSAQKTIRTLSTEYDWHLCYWDKNLQQSVSKRMTPGVSTWTRKNAEHKKLMKQYQVPFKTDYTICSSSGSSEIVSVASNKILSNKEIHSLAQLRPKLAHQANILWRKNDVLSLPFKGSPIEPEHAIEFTGIQPKFQFGNAVLTEKEMGTIRHLLSLKTIKEIAWIHQCCEAAEKKRLESIKQKFGCKNASRSALFQKLKEHGVIDACLDVYTTYL